MMGKAHLAVLERAANEAGGYYGDLLLAQRYWIERSTAGRFNDGVLRDWYYKKTPQTIWCIRRLTQAILDAPAADELQIAFLLHWVSHYFVDAIWTCHVAQRYMENASAAEKKEFDNGIEREVEEIADGPAFEPIASTGAGYWTHFWQGRLESDRRSLALIEAWRRGSGYIPISLESVPYCIASFTAYLDYLNRRHDLAALAQDAVPAAPRYVNGTQAVWSGAPAHEINAWTVALQCALETGRPVEECLASPATGAATAPAETSGMGAVAARQQPGSIAVAEPSAEGKAPVLVTACPAAEAGWRTDWWLDATGARFGTGEPHLARWPGEWVLMQGLSGAALAERVFTAEFADALTEIRGYARAEVEQEPEKAAPHAIEDRDRQLETMAAWLTRWDRATSDANAPQHAGDTRIMG
jgi:hypothetical protein